MKNAYEFVCMSYEGAACDDGCFNQYLHPRELEKIKKAVEKRRLEFLYGRLCAKFAYSVLSGCGVFDNRIYVMNDSRGAPFLEDGRYHVGITHDDKLAAAIVTDREQLRAGIDVQKISSKNTQVIYKFLSEGEKAFFEEQSVRYSQYSRDFLAAAVWVAKEALSKLFEYGFSVYDALEVSSFEQKDSLTVKFTKFSSFSVLLRPYGDYLFGFAANDRDIGNFGEGSLTIKETQMSALTALYTV